MKKKLSDNITQSTRKGVFGVKLNNYDFSYRI